MKFREKIDFNEIQSLDKIEKLFDEKNVSLCLELEKTIQDFWNVERSSAFFLNMLIKIKGAKSALEIGTSNGLSGIWIADALKKTNGKLTTIEFWQKRSDIAIENFKKAGVNDIITTITGDAIEILKEMQHQNLKFDFIFVDANKAEYIQYFDLYDPLLEIGGVIVSDNILSHYKKTRDFVHTLFNHPHYQSQILNFDAGIMISTKI